MRYLNQGRADHARPLLSPRRVSAIMLTRPETLRPDDVDVLEEIAAACPEMAATAGLVRDFTALLTPATGNDRRLTERINTAQPADLPHIYSFVRGLENDRDAVYADLTLEQHNGRTEGVNTKTKLIKRQMYGRAGFDLLRHRILLG